MSRTSLPATAPSPWAIRPSSSASSSTRTWRNGPSSSRIAARNSIENFATGDVVMAAEVLLYVGEALGKYGFPNGHPFGPDRQAAFWKETVKQGLDKRATVVGP